MPQLQILTSKNIPSTCPSSIRRSSFAQSIASKEEQYIKPEEDYISACLTCNRVLELFKTRSSTLIFNTEQTMEELKRLKMKFTPHWTEENIFFLL
jgi:hypothetical protein